MSAPRLLARFDDFTGGEIGLRSPRRAARNMFIGKNVMVFPDRSIGPRHGAIRLQGSSLNPSQGVHLVGWTPYGGSTGTVWWLDFAGNIRQKTIDAFYAPTPAWVNSGTVGTFGLTELFGAWNLSQTRTYIVGTNVRVTVISHDTASAATIAAPAPTGRCIARYGNRLYVGGADGVAYRVAYSNVGTSWAGAGNWSATNYFELPVTSAIVALIPQRDHLVIQQVTGNYWIFTGSPGVNETLRQATEWSQVNDPLLDQQIIDRVPAHAVGRTNRGELWHCPAMRRRPVRFDGVAPEMLEYLELSDTPTNMSYDGGIITSVAALDGPDDIVILGGIESAGYNGLSRHDRVWSRHLFDFASNYPPAAACQGPFGSVIIGTANTAGGTEAGIYWWMAAAEAPPLFQTPYKGRTAKAAAPDDGFTPLTGTRGTIPDCEFATAYVLAKDGGEFLVRHVVVHFTAYRTGDTVNSDHFEMSVMRHHVSEQPTITGTAIPTDTTPIVWNLDPTAIGAADGDSQHFTKKFSVAAGRCTAFAIEFTKMRGVKIEEIEVFGDGEPARVN